MDKPDLEKGVKLAQNLAEELLQKLEIKAEVKTKEENSSIYIDIEGGDLGLLIGYHGESLEALQLLLGLMINKNLGGEEWVPISLDIGGWREERVQAIRSLVKKMISEIGDSKDKVELPPMPASQRRTAHLILGEFPGFTSESIGDEPNRRVIIKKS